MATRHVFVAVATSLSMLLLAGCGGSRHDPTEKYFLVASNIKLPYWQAAGSGVASAAKQLGVPVTMVGPDTYDPQAELQIFNDVLSKKPSGILVSAADPKVLQPAIDNAIAQGIPVITIDSDAPTSKRLVFVGTNNYEAGVMGGKIANQLLGQKGSVIVYTITDQENLQERMQGYKSVLGDRIKILQVVNVKGDPRITFDTTNDIIEKGTLKPDGFICLEATACKEVADVLNRHKVSGKVIVAMDTDKDTLDWIKQGVIQATVAQKPFTMAYYGTKMLEDLHHNKLPNLNVNWETDTNSPLPKFVDTGASLIDKNNVDAFLKARDAAADQSK